MLPAKDALLHHIEHMPKEEYEVWLPLLDAVVGLRHSTTPAERNIPDRTTLVRGLIALARYAGLPSTAMLIQQECMLTLTPGCEFCRQPYNRPAVPAGEPWVCPYCHHIHTGGHAIIDTEDRDWDRHAPACVD